MKICKLAHKQSVIFLFFPQRNVFTKQFLGKSRTLQYTSDNSSQLDFCEVDAINTIQDELNANNQKGILSISPVHREASFDHNPPGEATPILHQKQQQQQPKRKFIHLPVTEHNRVTGVYYPQQHQATTRLVYKPTVVQPRIKKVPVVRYVPYSKVQTINGTTYAQPVMTTATPRYHTIVATAAKDAVPIIRAEPSMPQRFVQDA